MLATQKNLDKKDTNGKAVGSLLIGILYFSWYILNGFSYFCSFSTSAFEFKNGFRFPITITSLSSIGFDKKCRV
ncbi:hypothetical protein JOC83_002333 [Bacillus iocasae]|uniref:Uncharacterized protein n=1 Tax=Priestia iocasae TaxID=2291674 RepID=A0ABS2QVJ6_9BACI|nr:hypothetical protein [Metabacillus iocasae]MBM7703484.1 hypothetical protein [Metabacillus iocasae]